MHLIYALQILFYATLLIFIYFRPYFLCVVFFSLQCVYSNIPLQVPS